MENFKHIKKGSFKYKVNINKKKCQQSLEQKREITVDCIKIDKYGLVNIWGSIINKTTNLSTEYTGVQNIVTNAFNIIIDDNISVENKLENFKATIQLVPLVETKDKWQVIANSGEAESYTSIAKFTHKH